MVSSFTLLALASGAIALQVTSPSKSSVWTVGDSQTVTWDTVSSDQDTFNIYLSNMASYPTTTILLASDISSSAGSAKIDGSKLTTGNAFTINFTNGTETEQIYAQSSQFNITESTTSSSSASSSASETGSSTSSKAASSTSTGAASSSSEASSSSAASSSASETASSTLATSKSSSASATATGTSSADSTAKPSSTSSGSSSNGTSSATSGAGRVVAGWVGLAAAAAMAL